MAGDALAALPRSSSATGEQVSTRTPAAGPWRPLALRLPSLLHSRLDPLRSSFSEELVMVAGTGGGEGREGREGKGEIKEREGVFTKTGGEYERARRTMGL